MHVINVSKRYTLLKYTIRYTLILIKDTIRYTCLMLIKEIHIININKIYNKIHVINYNMRVTLPQGEQRTRDMLRRPYKLEIILDFGCTSRVVVLSLNVYNNA